MTITALVAPSGRWVVLAIMALLVAIRLSAPNCLLVYRRGGVGAGQHRPDRPNTDHRRSGHPDADRLG
jgi:hypothetical protein